MSEYIERKEVYSEINKLPLTEDAAMEILWAIDDIPTADIAPVIHGQWLSVESDVIFACSNCGNTVSTNWDYENSNDMFSYCPNCGAKMDMDGEPHDP